MNTINRNQYIYSLVAGLSMSLALYPGVEADAKPPQATKVATYYEVVTKNTANMIPFFPDYKHTNKKSEEAHKKIKVLKQKHPYKAVLRVILLDNNKFRLYKGVLDSKRKLVGKEKWKRINSGRWVKKNKDLTLYIKVRRIENKKAITKERIWRCKGGKKILCTLPNNKKLTFKRS